MSNLTDYQLTKFQRLARIWLMPVLLIVCLVFFVIVSADLYFQNEKRYRSAKSEQVAEAISKAISGEIWQRVTFLKVVGNQPKFFDNHHYAELARSLTVEYADFYAVNLINRKGIIAKVFPKDRNQAALGKNLFAHPVVAPLLFESRIDGNPRMSYLLNTYQKIRAFVLYVPLYDKNKESAGWLNAVVDLDTWLKRYIDNNFLQRAHIKISWDDPESQFIEEGPADIKETFRYKYQILNQSINIEVGFQNSDFDNERFRYFVLVMVVGIVLMLLITLFLIELTLARVRASANNSYLALKNSLLSSLTHDISSPLMVLAINFEKAKVGEALTFVQKERIEHSLIIMEEMLKNARFLHAQELGFIEIKLEAVPLAKAVQDSLLLVAEQAAKKRVRIEVGDIPEIIRVQADPGTLANNIFLNAFTNAIKFSPLDSVIKVYAEFTPSEVRLIFEDQGRGFTKKQIKNYKLFNTLSIEEGSSGERGTGLGLLQIRSLLGFYDGSLVLENTEKTGARVILIMKRR